MPLPNPPPAGAAKIMCNAQGAVLLLAIGCDRRLWVLACAKVLGACTQPSGWMVP